MGPDNNYLHVYGLQFNGHLFFGENVSFFFNGVFLVLSLSFSFSLFLSHRSWLDPDYWVESHRQV